MLYVVVGIRSCRYNEEAFEYFYVDTKYYIATYTQKINTSGILIEIDCKYPFDGL